MTALKPCIDCGRLTLGSLDAAAEYPICWRPCYLLRALKGAVTVKAY